MYNDAQLKIDRIAKRLTPLHTFEDSIGHNKLKVKKRYGDDDAAQLIVDSLSTLLSLERPILKGADEIGDEGTNSMISDFISEQEKVIWRLKAFLEETI